MLCFCTNVRLSVGLSVSTSLSNFLLFLLLCLCSVLLMKAVGTLGDVGYFSSTSFAHTHTHTYTLAYFPRSFPSGWVCISVVTETDYYTHIHSDTHTDRCAQLQTHTRCHVLQDKVIN